MMILIKKIKTDEDFRLIQQDCGDPDPEKHIYVICYNKLQECIVAKMQPKEAPGFWKKLTSHESCYSDGIWISPSQFSLDMTDCTLKTGDTKNPLLVNFKVNATIQPRQSPETILQWLSKKDTLSDVDLNTILQCRKQDLLNFLQDQFSQLENAGTASPQDILSDAICHAMTMFFPPLSIEMSFAEQHEILSQQEIMANEIAEQNAARQMELLAKEKQNDYEMSLAEIQQKKNDFDSALKIQETARAMELAQKEMELKILHETEPAKIEKIKKQMELEQQTMSSEIEIRSIQRELAVASEHSKIAELRRQEEEAVSRHQLALQKLRQEQSAIDAQSDLLRFKQELEKEQLLAEQARVKEDAQFHQLRIAELEKLLENPDSLSIIDMMGLPCEKLGSMRYLKGLVLAKLKERSARKTLNIVKNELEPAKSRSVMMGGVLKPKAVRINSQFNIKLRSQRDGHLTLICFSTEGEIQLICPNCFEPECMVSKGCEKSCPDIPLFEVGPCGQEIMVAIVSDRPLTSPDILPPQDNPSFVTLTAQQYHSLIDALYQSDNWDAAQVTYFVE